MVIGYDPTKNNDYKKAFCTELIDLKYNDIEEILFAKDETIYYPLVITQISNFIKNIKFNIYIYMYLYFFSQLKYFNFYNKIFIYVLNFKN